ncbi:MAG: DUF3737 family protein [Clostridia bacterium]|nr:DUF3737 family protein [Clostridia bacterium]
MKTIKNQSFDNERALYESTDLEVIDCKFTGEADGESALKESKDIVARGCYFNLRYPFWHDDEVLIEKCEFTPLCRAPIWYSSNIKLNNCLINGVKALRECEHVTITSSCVVSTEFGWDSRRIDAKDSQFDGEYFMARSKELCFENVKMSGKYSFQYIENSTFDNCSFDTKDAFWHAKNVTVKNSTIKGEYLGWYSEGLTLENCTIIGTQPLCYCKGLKLINCKMELCDLAFERSYVEATVDSHIDSIKNPKSGFIKALSVGEIIRDYPEFDCKIDTGCAVL